MRLAYGPRPTLPVPHTLPAARPQKLQQAESQLGLEVHGLLVGRQVGAPFLSSGWFPIAPPELGCWRSHKRPAAPAHALPALRCAVQVTEAMHMLCTHLHVFKSWSVVGGEGNPL